MSAPDPVTLARDLIRCPSVTPADAGALGVCEAALSALGFACEHMPFSEPGHADIDNLYARIGTGGPIFAFAGHTDVVPAGDPTDWSHDPFAAEIVDGVLHGRGAVDMKGGVAAFIAAAGRFVARRGADFGGRIALVLTGDEEAEAVNGTAKMMRALAERGEAPEVCVVGEPTNPDSMGEMMKIGRRGSLVGRLTVHGIQGHTAYPHRADNPAERLVRMLATITAAPLDGGTAHFDPSTLAITSIDIGNPATNVIPATARAVFNIRYNDRHHSSDLEAWLRATFDRVGGRYDLSIRVTGESFMTEPGAFTDLVADAVERVTGRRPEASTTGGTSDARFIKHYCPVVEFGLISRTIHQVDERVALADIETLTQCYEAMLERYFA